MAWLDKITGTVENLALGSARKKREAQEAEEAAAAEEEKKKKKKGGRGPFLGRGQMTDEEWDELNKASGGK